MNKKLFSWLLIITFLAGVMVLLVPKKAGQATTFESTALLPGLSDAANELQYLQLTAAGDEVVATFERIDGQWQLREAESYAADWDRLRPLLSDLSQAKIIEPKTSNPEFYSRLGVQDVADPEAGGVMIQFADGTGIPALIVGNSPTGREGQYVRLVNSADSALIDRGLDVPADRMQWLDRDIIDVSRDEVVEATVTHPDGDTLKVTKTSADDTDFQLATIPEGRELSSNWSVNSLAGGLAVLSLDEVRSDTEFNWSSAVVYTLLTADGMRVTCWLLDGEEGRWIRLGASVYRAMDNEIDPDPEIHQEFAEILGARVNEINERVSGWAYRIPDHQFDVMTKRLEDVLKPTEEPGS